MITFNVGIFCFVFKRKTAYELRISDWSSDVCSSDLPNTVGDMVKRLPGAAFVGSDIMEYDGVQLRGLGGGYTQVLINGKKVPGAGDDRSFWVDRIPAEMVRSEEHTSELQSLMRISYAVFCLKKKKNKI